MLPPLKPKDLAKVHGAQQDQDQGYGSSCRPHHFPSYHTMAPSSFPLTRQSRDSLRAVHLLSSLPILLPSISTGLTAPGHSGHCSTALSPEMLP